MGLNSPIPVRLPDECRKAAKILRSFVDTTNNGLDKVIPRSVLERAKGFAIFTVFKAGFVISARAGSGVVIARLEDGSWSAPSAIGLGGFGFGGQMGAEMTDFFVVLNSRSAVTSFMSAGSLTLGGNLSVAVGPLGRNAEGSAAVNNKGKIAAIYSYSKTKGLFGGVSVEGSIIVERQDANRLAYGGNPSVKQILSGAIDPPDWAGILIDQLDKATGLPGGQQWRQNDEDGEGGGMGYSSRERSGSTGYAFGQGIGTGGRESPNIGGNVPEKSTGNIISEGRKRAGSLFSNSEKSGNPVRPSSLSRRTSSFNPFNSGSSSPRRAVLPSSESYNAGLTWDSSGPIQQYGNRSRSGSSALRPLDSPSAFNSTSKSMGSDRETDSIRDFEPHKPQEDDSDLLGHWDADGSNISASFAKLSTAGRHDRNSSKPQTPFDDIVDIGDDHLPKLWDSPNKIGQTSRQPPSAKVSSPFSDLTPRQTSSSRPFDDYFPSQTTVPPPIPRKPQTSSPGGLADKYPKAVALFDFRPTDPGDLGLVAGEIVRCLDSVGKGDWWRGMDSEGKAGIFPNSYVEVVEIPKEYKGGLTRTQLKARLGGNEFD